MKGYGRWEVSNDGLPWGLLAILPVAGVVYLACRALLTTDVVTACVVAVSTVCAAGVAVVVRNVHRDRGLLWRPGPAAITAPAKQLLTRPPVAAIESRKVIPGVVLDESGKVASW